MISDDFKWIDCEDLPLINNEESLKYWSFSDFVERNVSSLMNHKLENIKIEELCEHILNQYQANIEYEIEYHLERLYSRVFSFVYLPETQNYFQKMEISIEIGHIGKILKHANDKKVKEFIKEKSEWYIDNFKWYYENGFGIKKSYNIPTADKLIETFQEEIIEKYVEDENIIY